MFLQGLLLLAFLPSLCLGAWPAYRKLAKSDVPYATIGKRESAAAAATACGAMPGCAAYNSDGELKSCAGCEGGSDCCVYPAGAQDFPAADRVDLFVKTGNAPPAEWAADVARGSMLYAQPEPDICMMPEVGNGFVASVVGFSSMHVSGFFNGGCGGVSKAHLPSVIGISVTNSDVNLTQAALDMDRGVYVRRLHVGGAIVEQRIYAHRIRKHVLVTEFELLGVDKPWAKDADATTSLRLTTLFDPLCGPAPPPPPKPAFNGSYLKVSSDSGGNGHDVGSVAGCQTGKCPVEKIRDACDANSKCDLFQTHGFLKQCSGGIGPTNATAACNPKTPWPGVDTYYKIRDNQDAEEPAPGPDDAGFGQGQACGTTGNGCAGSFKRDVVFERLKGSVVESLPSEVTVFRGNTTRTNESGISDTAVIVSRTVPSMLVLSAGKVERFLAVVTTTVAMPSSYDPVAAAIAEYHVADGDASVLLPTHVQAWKSIWDGGSIEVVGVAEDETGRALDIQSHLRSSFYYLISSIREDWPHGALNPGGLASDNYDTVFFDMEFYMEPALLWFWTPLARAMTEFRFEGLPAAEKQAEIFGYKGAQFPWCTVSFGRSSGCCDGKGGFELCLEQHITPDVGFAMQQYFRWTGDKEWLTQIGYPIAKGVAEWITSRATLGVDGAYHINKVMPVDEWCDQSSGCGSPGVNDDPQMNGASVAALKFAVEASQLLGKTPDPKWLEISNKLLIPRGNMTTPLGIYNDVHLMPNGTVPFGTVMFEGKPFNQLSPAALKANPKAGHASVCPEDVMYLSYPMGPALNISSAMTQRDLDAWIGSGMTCLENGGMTHPIRLISFLIAQEHNTSYHRLAEQALNGTMYGCCYGPYNLRNEIDRHNTTVGGHNSNTHFVTGDGGFINAFVSGFGGLMLGASQDALRLSRPTVPERTQGLRFKGLDYLGTNLTYELTPTTVAFGTTSHGSDTADIAPRDIRLCLIEGGKVHKLPVTLDIASVSFPAALGPC